MEFVDSGCPVMTVEEKLEALAACVRQGWHEDACGHLCDLLSHLGMKARPADSFQEIVAYYGSCLTPIREAP